VRLVRGRAVHVGLQTVDRPRHLGQGGSLDVVGGRAGERLLPSGR
jgi:hypothetical protein